MNWNLRRQLLQFLLLSAVFSFSPGSFGLVSLVMAVESELSEQIDFNRDIRPILSDACFACHGPDEAARESELRLDTREGMFADLGGYQAIVSGDPQASELYSRIVSKDSSLRMPPEDSPKQLSEQQIEQLRRWIEQGAKYREHWAFEKPVKPPLPDAKSASGEHSRLAGDAWPANEIDYFVLQRLREAGLTPQPEAPREILLRRVTLDLTGLPPTPQELDDFLADDSPRAYEKVVDRLLQSQHYGEHMARYWLDAARYGDTHGLHLDNYREMWPYRDWVVDAFNRNLPFDQFIVEQLAGDLLPDATLEQKIASGFNRAHVTTNEGGTIPEEFYVRNVVDRVDTAGQVFMGLTIGCAVCHDHKYDPISQKEYYQLFAFFNNLDGSPMDGNVKDHAPFVYVPSPEQEQQLQALMEERATLEEAHQQRGREIEAAFLSWLNWQQELLASGSQAVLPASEPPGLILHLPMDEATGARLLSQQDAKVEGALEGDAQRIEGKRGKAIEFPSADAYVNLGDVAAFKKADSFSFGAWVRTPGEVTAAAISKMDQAQNSGYELQLDGSRVRVLMARSAPDLAMHVSTQEEVLKPNQWQHLFVTYDGSERAAGIALYVDGKRQKLEIHSDQLGKYDFNTGKPLQLGRRDQQPAWVGGAIDDVRFYDRQLSDSEVAQLALAAEMENLLAIGSEARSQEQTQRLRDYHLTQFDSVYRQQAAEIQPLREQETSLKRQMPTTLVFRERQEPRPAYVLQRGEYDRQGEKVQRNTPSVLPPMDPELPRDRLGFARWLVSESHPLTARVSVNRFWQQLFGTGLVKTSEDFGSQGEPPSHPLLLDWLAVDFRDSGWDVKRFMKQMVMSSTYRQSSAGNADSWRLDPGNRLLSRGPRFRLDAEMLRDQALAVGDLLVPYVGGPSVKPPQPEGLWFAVGYSGSNTVRFKADEGPDKVHRRTLYTFIKRTAPPPQMSTLDAPSRESCVLRRERTNTPLQALLLLNDPQYVEAARGLAQRVLKKVGGQDDRAGLEYLYRLCTAKRAEAETMRELQSLLEDERKAYAEDLQAAQAFVSVGETPPNDSLDPVELAAWTMVANTVLNLDEVLCKN